MKIGIYGTARNEIANLDDWVKTTRGADVVCINDTGSTDDTFKELCKYKTGQFWVSAISPKPMQLSNALNIAMAQLPDDCDLAIRLDLDERLPDNWRDDLDSLNFPDGPVIVRAWFDHMGCTYRHTRIHSRHGFHWELPVHEILVSDEPATHVFTDLTFEHHQDPNKDRSQVLGELEAAVAADPENMRMVHYLGREYTYRGMWGEAIPLLRRHAASDEFAEERSESYRLLGDAYCALMPIEDVPARVYEMAAETCRERREGWVALADFWHKCGDWDECLDATDQALDITERSWYFNWPWAWGAKPYDLAALAFYYLGHRAEAVKYGEEAVRLEPDDQRLQDNLVWYREDG